MTTLHHKYRPTKMDDLVGQKDVTNAIKKRFSKPAESPRCILFTGGSGCGKTTTARILKARLKCSDSCFTELNCADVRGIDAVRKIRQEMNRAPIGGKSVIYLIDEAHQLTKDAQNALLKILEEPPKHVWFFLCTTEPDKLIKTIQTRATQYAFKELKRRDMLLLLNRTAKSEGFALDEEVADRISEYADGSPRRALVLLDQVYRLDNTEDQLNVLQQGDSRQQAIALARALINPRVKWNEVAKILKDLDDEPEGVRRMVLGYCSSIMLGNSKVQRRAYEVASIFNESFFTSGRAGLITACYELVNDSN